VNPFQVEEILMILLLIGIIVAYIYLNNSKKFDKGVVKKVRYKPEEQDAEAAAGEGKSEKKEE